MKYTLEIPDALFKSSVVITKTESNDDAFKVIGYEITTDATFNPSKGWLNEPFGFVTTTVDKLTLFEKMYHVQHVISFAMKHYQNYHQELEFLFLVYMNTLNVYWRIKSPNLS